MADKINTSLLYQDYSYKVAILEANYVGLEKIYELTSSATYSLRFDMEDFNGVRKFALYDNFKLDDASKNYKLNFDNYIGNAGDSFSYHKGNRFATFDNDHNGCSVGYSGAWWYNLCLYSNLNGLYNSTEFGKGINWKNWHGLYYSLKTTEIKNTTNKQIKLPSKTSSALDWYVLRAFSNLMNKLKRVIKNPTASYKQPEVYECQTSVDSCSQLCHEVYLCVSFFYHDDFKICQLHSVQFLDSNAGISSTGWKYCSVNKPELKPIDCEDLI
ncbi:hypothetical protein KUTeg_006645 [Tegillarca granosa]|uniref:Fibrinogen C-terminal domain-containing protein n=1 Tax=Tegillarca granosa TaxID=220873 RepID=A0ABQ9FAX4_TEGGR|nr:hypothetical protein KUTeg_006645 [Tegillarca granosa]